ncbi:hypothetical protein GCM10008986_02510 [Salinibacillus aidingensis]|uniref:DUF4309 domain-containing protein n=1 Tax=Salinibacillus aidingensis TaxID=237684 RepID=A0ABN1APQ0_9BACI
MKNNENNHEIEKMLNQMPKIQDHQDEEELFKKVQQQLQRTQNKQRNRKVWTIPAMTTAAVMLIAVILISVITNQNPTADMAQDMENSSEESASSEDTGTPSHELKMMSPEENDASRDAESSPLPEMDKSAPRSISGLQIGMTYDEVIKEIGSPLEYEDTENQRSLKYSTEGYGIKLQFKKNSQTVNEFTFIPRYLQDTQQKLTIHPLFLRQKIEGIRTMLGGPMNEESVSCFENTTCEEYTYKLNSKDRIVVRTSWNKEDIEFIKLLRQEHQ